MTDSMPAPSFGPVEFLAGGQSPEDVFGELEARRSHDVRWREGRAFSLAYYAGPEVAHVAEEAYRRFSGENALNTAAFPSLEQMQREVLGIVGQWLGANDDSAGFFTSGGTESLLMAVKAARDRARAEHGINTPNMVLPTSAHAAFEKAAAYFGVESRRIPVRSDWRADVPAMHSAVDANTVLIVGSAPQYPQGVIDDIPGIAAIAREYDINCHVDACMGGVTLPYLAKLGHTIAPWNLNVDGVSSISVDLHKFGYTAKGASVIMYATRKLRSYQIFITSNWLGGLYGSSGVLGTKSGGSIAAAWATLRHLGDEGYLRLTDSAYAATKLLANYITSDPRLVLRAKPEAMLVCFGASEEHGLDIFAVADELWRRGWYVDRQEPPRSLHCTVNAVHQLTIEAFTRDLARVIDYVVSTGAHGAAVPYGTV
ncbi:MAG: aspartate aminotransferase family protein [Acidimicrobiaceae bacterium]|nr:aspartate aminotransferase family protein [Acidimicrobiaceae bacterium]